MRARDDQTSLSGPEKAAVLIMSVGDAYASQLFAVMEADEIQEISQSMSELGPVSAVMVEQLFAEFSEKISTPNNLVGTPEATERLLKKVMGKERGDKIMNSVQTSGYDTMWTMLEDVNEQLLANYLKNEYPQTVAVILTKLRPKHAAKVMAALPESLSLEVVDRMLDMDSVTKEVSDDVEETLRREFISTLSKSENKDSHEAVAEIINSLDRSTENRLMARLEESDQDAANKIKKLMFTFDDLTKVDAAGIQTLLRVVEKKTLIVALKGASESLKWKFLENMTQRTEQMMQDDLAAMGPVRLREVDEAQAKIVAIAKDLFAKSEIIFSDDGESELIYQGVGNRG
ncbi:MAG: Flagellar motor switch protein FliG [Alphaproteobacteria bacterium MarineAlpha4_Bin2]|nr:MAG: Flagellar motor switch protein FliG [Alphaproteobacteria bacterium MarineAlpha4_Bin2]